jgi:hypothetical protein
MSHPPPTKSVSPNSRRRPRFLEGAKPHELYDPPLPAPKYGETRAEYNQRAGLDQPDDGRIFRGWVKNRSLNYREQWLNPASFEVRDKQKREAHRKYDSRNRAPKNAERNARRDGTLEGLRGTEKLHRLSISKHGITSEQYDAMTPEQRALLVLADKAGVTK